MSPVPRPLSSPQASPAASLATSSAAAQDVRSVGGTEGAGSQSDTGGGSTPVDLSAADEPASQPKLKQCPVSVFAHKARSFSSHWYDEYAFLEYSIVKDAVYCKMCRHSGERGGEEKFRRDGYKDWKHMNSLL